MRLFVAIWPPPAVVADLSWIEHPDGGTVRWAAPSRWHVTLAFLGNPDPAGPDDDAATPEAVAVEEAVASLRRVPLGAHAGTVARLDTVTASFGRSVLTVPVLGLDALAAAVRSAYSSGPGCWPGTDPVPFNGHLTLGRARRRGDDVRPLAGMPVGPAGGTEWAVDEVALVASMARDGKGHYETLSTVPVPGDDYPTSNMRSGLQ